MHKQFIAAIVVLFSAAALTGAQAPQDAGQPQTAPRPTTQSPTATAQQPTTTLVGCLYREDQVPGRQPNVAERAGVLEDYILADAAMPSGQAKPGTAVGTSGTAPSSGTMYKVEGPADEQLKALVGKRVEVTGRADPQRGPGGAPAAATPDRGPGPDDINLPEFEAASIKETSGTCPATPSAATPATPTK